MRDKHHCMSNKNCSAGHKCDTVVLSLMARVASPSSLLFSSSHERARSLSGVIIKLFRQCGQNHFHPGKCLVCDLFPSFLPVSFLCTNNVAGRGQNVVPMVGVGSVMVVARLTRRQDLCGLILLQLVAMGGNSMRASGWKC